jgi:cellobiose-specific phosphotransferase system component IIC
MTLENEQLSQILQQMATLNSKVEELTQQNRDLRAMMNGAISTLPIIVKDELQTFITQFTESLEKQEPSKTAEAIRELTGVLKDLKERLTRSELIHADMTAQVSTATDEIRLISQKLLAQDNATKSAID